MNFWSKEKNCDVTIIYFKNLISKKKLGRNRRKGRRMGWMTAFWKIDKILDMWIKQHLIWSITTRIPGI